MKCEFFLQRLFQTENIMGLVFTLGHDNQRFFINHEPLLFKYCNRREERAVLFYKNEPLILPFFPSINRTKVYKLEPNVEFSIFLRGDKLKIDFNAPKEIEIDRESVYVEKLQQMLNIKTISQSERKSNGQS